MAPPEEGRAVFPAWLKHLSMVFSHVKTFQNTTYKKSSVSSTNGVCLSTFQELPFGFRFCTSSCNQSQGSVTIPQGLSCSSHVECDPWGGGVCKCHS